MLSSKTSTIDFRDVMDEGRVVLINLSKGVLRTNSFLLGALFVAKIQMAAMSRQELAPSQRRTFHLYVDEFQNYATFSFAEIMSEARKYGLSLVLAHQSLEQLDEKLRSIILANAKNLVAFRTDRMDAELLIKYLVDYDPYSVKQSSLEGSEYFGIAEQQELGIAELAELPERMAVLKTKGCDPRFFATYDLPDSDDGELNRELVREQNRLAGYTLGLRELDAALVLESATWSEPDEPEGFVE
jgi:hypothetical protein